MKIHSKQLLFPAFLAAFLCAPAESQEKPLVIRGAQVFNGEGAFMKGVTVRLVNGKIDAIGKVEALPTDQIIEAKGLFLTPGLINANTALGLPSAQENEQSEEVTPAIQVKDAIDLESPAFRFALQGGVTTACVSPGGYNVIGGLDAILKTGGPLGERLLKSGSGLRVTLGQLPGMGNRPPRWGKPTSMYNRRPTTRMGTIWEIRRAFYKAQKYRDTKARKQPDRGTRVLINTLQGKIRCRMTARSDQDLRTALRLAKEFGLKIVIDGGVESYFVLDRIQKAGFPILLTAPSQNHSPDGATPHLDTAALLAKKGIRFAIQTGRGMTPLSLIQEAAFAVRGGLSRDQAMAAITSVPADILGIADRVGRIKKNLDADLVLWSGHPLSLGSHPIRVLISGKTIIEEAKH
jgi:imidazolonepropionase-like amidohydrolase